MREANERTTSWISFAWFLLALLGARKAKRRERRAEPSKISLIKRAKLIEYSKAHLILLFSFLFSCQFLSFFVILTRTI